MTVRNPIPKDALELYQKLKAKKVHHLEIGRQVGEAFPDRFGGMTPLSVYNGCERELGNAAFRAEVAEAGKALPEPVDLPPIMDRLEVPYEDALLLSDVHLPYHDENVLSEALAFSRAAKLKLCVLNGDIVDLHWASDYVNLTSEDVGESFRQLGQFYVTLLESGIRTILHNFGNHEDRIMRKTGGKLALWSLIALSIDTLPSRERLRVRKAVSATNRHYVRLKDCPDGKDWVIGHPRRYRKKRLSLSSEIAQGRTLSHVATGHQHHYGFTISENGQYWAVDLPCTQDPERVEYLSVGLDPASSPVRGFGWLFDGVPGLWWSEASDEWKAWQLESAKARARHIKKRKAAA